MPAPEIKTAPRFRKPGAIRWMPEYLRTRTSGPVYEYRSGDPATRSACSSAASYPARRRLPQPAQKKLVALKFRIVPIQRARRWAVDHVSVDRKNRVMAGTDKLVLVVLPVIGAPQVRALRRKRGHLVVLGPSHPDRGLLADHLPAVDPVTAKGHLLRHTGSEFADIADLNPFLIATHPGWN